MPRIFKEILRKSLNFSKKCILRKNGVVIGKNSLIRRAELGRCVKIGDNCNVQGAQISDFSYCGDNCYLPQTKIGKFCSIARSVELAAGTHPQDYLSTHPLTYSNNYAWQGVSFLTESTFDNEFCYVDHESKIVCEIGNDVWICTRALLVCNGKEPLRIGDGCIVAAGAVVTKSLPPYSIAAGVPAQIIGKRFDDDFINVLENSRWWDRDKGWFQRNAAGFSNPKTLDL